MTKDYFKEAEEFIEKEKSRTGFPVVNKTAIRNFAKYLSQQNPKEECIACKPHACASVLDAGCQCIHTHQDPSPKIGKLVRVNRALNSGYPMPGEIMDKLNEVIEKLNRL